MTLPSSFTQYSLANRLGQALELAVCHTQAFGREYVFVAPLAQHASSLVAKNAEHFAFQLRERFNLDARRFEMVELRGDPMNPQFWRWRFEWVGNSPLSPKCELISSHSQHNQMLTLLNIHGGLQVATA
ncbi:hypothetical protein GCM10011613_09100 [Cellvibrio zantedeschiae]|uniref:Uncharacterized protein n=1 Tax=Cellvibrio zantedeschiae TaxID=1237077 RepID=A0ABQ3ATX5_9GAMM|nr:hypothetical protein [Cellvibrio zantedeschiae]GGY67181.1 hypothetical protein GCM10011613_09100 [Cellvibrio zantedeschiae]